MQDESIQEVNIVMCQKEGVSSNFTPVAPRKGPFCLWRTPRQIIFQSAVKASKMLYGPTSLEPYHIDTACVVQKEGIIQ